MGTLFSAIFGIWLGLRLWKWLDDKITRWQLEETDIHHYPDGIIVVTFPRLKGKYRSLRQKEMAEEKIHEIGLYKSVLRTYGGDNYTP